MSRIHEALKKAEQDRVGVVGGEENATPAVTSRSEVGVATEQHPVSGQRAEWPEPQSHGPVSMEVLDARCARPTWTPDAKIACLMSSGKSVMGSEELRTLRSRLHQIRERQQPNLRKVLITSALPGEGKTFLTASLGLMIARQHGRRVLLVDADLRRPQLHTALGAPGSPGLTEYLSGAASELEIIQHGVGSNLYLMPAGKLTANPTELLANGLLGALLDRLAPNFDWILLDSPPAVPLHDASVLADICNGVLMVVRAAATPFDVAQKVRAELHQKNILGVVLNQVERSSDHHAYYYNYYNGGGNGSKVAK